MAKIQIKSEKLTPFGGIFSIMEQFDALLAQTIDSTLGRNITVNLTTEEILENVTEDRTRSELHSVLLTISSPRQMEL